MRPLPRSRATALAACAAARVAALAAYLNGLPVTVPGAEFNCPDWGNGGMTVAFLARPGGPVIAKATASLSGCEFVNVTMPGQQPAGMGGADAGSALLTEVNHVAGLHWKIP